MIREVVAACPKCKTFETLWFNGYLLLPAARFRQGPDGRVYHDCQKDGLPCRLFPRFVEPKKLTL